MYSLSSHKINHHNQVTVTLQHDKEKRIQREENSLCLWLQLPNAYNEADCFPLFCSRLLQLLPRERVANRVISSCYLYPHLWLAMVDCIIS